MTSVAAFDLSGRWVTRDGLVVVVRRSKRPIAAYIALLPDGRECYITAEGNGYDNHKEYDLLRRLPLKA